MPERECHQCWGKGWLPFQGKRITCPCVVLDYLIKKEDPASERGPIPSCERAHIGYGASGALSSIVAENGTPAAVSQTCSEFIVSMTKARLADG